MPTAAEQKPLKEIIKDLLEKADEYSLGRWLKGDSYSCNVSPPDVIAVIDQIEAIPELAKDTKLPMQLLWQIASTLSISENVQESITGHTLLTCHAEIAELTKFATSLATKEVNYPLQDKDPDEDEKEE